VTVHACRRIGEEPITRKGCSEYRSQRLVPLQPSRPFGRDQVLIMGHDQGHGSHEQTDDYNAE
jgi:hypothetical protein